MCLNVICEFLLLCFLCRSANMLQRLDGSGWRDNLPSVSSSSNLAGLVTGNQSNESQSAINEKTFETCKAQGNSLFSKVFIVNFISETNKLSLITRLPSSKKIRLTLFQKPNHLITLLTLK